MSASPGDVAPSLLPHDATALPVRDAPITTMARKRRRLWTEGMAGVPHERCQASLPQERRSARPCGATPAPEDGTARHGGRVERPTLHGERLLRQSARRPFVVPFAAWTEDGTLRSRRAMRGGTDPARDTSRHA